MKYRTKQGDMLDSICLAYYGTLNGTTELVLEANRELANYPAKLPAGLLIELPDIKTPVKETETEQVRLWV